MGISPRLTLFGGFRLSDTGKRQIAIAGTKAALLFAYLGLHAGKTQGREKLMELLWSQRSEHQARGSLRQALWAIRRALESFDPCPLITEGDLVSLDGSEISVDVLDFEGLLAEGTPDALGSALALYTGELLEGIRVTDPAFEEFLRGERLRLYGMAVDACSRLLEYQLENGMDRSAVTTAKRLLSIDPLQEVAHRMLMRHYAERGQVGLARKQYQMCRDVLQKELQVEPDAKTYQLYERIRLAHTDNARAQTKSQGVGQPELQSSDVPTQPGPDLPRPAVSIGNRDHEPDLQDTGRSCSRCQHQNPVHNKFCGNCGKSLAADCPGCGATNPSGQKYCGNCGVYLSRVPAPRFSSPDDYTPEHLAKRILTSQGALEGERKQATALFADLKGSMEQIAGRDPEEIWKIVNPFLQTMIDAVHRYEGTVNKVLGDGIMALFGVPLTHEDHAIHACFAALAMRDAVPHLARPVEDGMNQKFQVRVGINSGDVIVRAIGNDLSMDYDAIGPTTLLAGRMEQLASPGSIRITRNTLRLAEGFIRVRPLDKVAVEGLDEEIHSYELKGATQTRSRFRASAARGVTPLVGRGTELKELHSALDLAEKGKGQVVATIGDPGVGKSRLFHEFTQPNHTADRLILESGSASYDKAVPFLPVIELLKTYFQLDDRDVVHGTREKIRSKLLALDKELLFALPALLGLLDAQFDDPSWSALQPSERRRRALDAIKMILIKESQVQPLIVVFEDLQWADNETQTFLDHLVESLPTARILLLVSYRPEYHHDWAGKTYYTQLRIDPLPIESTNKLLDALLGRAVGLAPLKKMITERTEGNPFFVEESVRTLVETGTLQGGMGEYRLTRNVELIEIPATVHGVVVARIDRLGPEEKLLIQTASVIGKDVSFRMLEAIMDMSEHSLRSLLAQLQAAELIYETRLFPDPEYTFKHVVTHEVAYNSLLVERRRELHGQIVDAIERLYPLRRADHIERLAHHAIQAEQWTHAVEFLRQASAKASGMSAYREAAASLVQALDAVEHLPESRETIEQGIDLRFELRSSLQALGRHEQVFECLGEAERLATLLADRDRMGWASAYLSQYLWRMGYPEQAEESGHRALSIASDLNDLALDVVTNFFLGQGHYNTGSYQPAADHCRSVVATLQGDKIYDRLGLTGLPAVLSRIFLAWSLAEQGQFEEALLHAEEARSIAEATDQHYSVAAAYLGLGHIKLVRGNFDQAKAALEHATVLCNTWNLQVILSSTARLLSLTHALSGRIAEALSVEDKGGSEESTIYIFDTPTARTAPGMIQLLAGNLDVAAGIAAETATLTAERSFRGSHAKSLQLLGDISAHGSNLDETQAEEHYYDALTLANELDMHPVSAHCHFGIGKLYRRRGKRKKSEEHIAMARTMYSEMGMDSWMQEALG